MGTAYSQYSVELKSIEKEIIEGNYKIAEIKLKKIGETKLPPSYKAQYTYLLAKCFSNSNEEEKAYKYYLDAKNQFKAIDSIDKEKKIALEIFELLNSQENNPNKQKKYLNEYLNYAKGTNDPVKLAHGYIALATLKRDEGNYNASHNYYKKVIELLKKTKNTEIESIVNNNIASLYIEKLENPKLGLLYLQEELKNIKLRENNFEDLCHNYVNQAAAYYFLENYPKAIQHLKMADSLPLKRFIPKTKQYIYEFLYKNYDELKDYPNAYKYLLLNKKFADSVNVTEQNIAMSDIQTKYQTAEKELENTELKSNIKTNRILLYTFTSLLIASLIIAFLVYKNAKRREKISLQEKLIEQQKLEKALKDYELHSIDLMLEGQEKERQRIANDLHDNLGSMLATLKLNFENLRLRKNELKDEENKLYERTDELIEEAYQKVRRLAHAKNAGVFASQGLIPAIKKLAEKISIPGKLQIQVIPFGFNDRLENTLEIAIFRAVQELSTNIIKHSEATEATIHLTNHEDNINIIIEDNGVGFDSKKISTADGMGLQTIQKKIIQLGGTFTIDTTPGKGTTIIIDIPV